MSNKRTTIIVRFPTVNIRDEFSNYHRYTKNFSNVQNAMFWAEEKTREIEQNRGNLWPTEILVNGVSVGYRPGAILMEMAI